jgi:hypothetical protein
VTRQPAIKVGIFLAMAFNTESHLELLALDAVHGPDFSVAFLAFNFFSDVALMIEQHMFG